MGGGGDYPGYRNPASGIYGNNIDHGDGVEKVTGGQAMEVEVEVTKAEWRPRQWR